MGEWSDHLLCGQTICSVVRPSALWWQIIHQLGAETGKCVVVVFGMAFSITTRLGVTSRARASHSAFMEGITLSCYALACHVLGKTWHSSVAILDERVPS